MPKPARCAAPKNPSSPGGRLVHTTPDKLPLRRNETQCRKWEDKYNELVEYRKWHGHCNIPSVYLSQNPNLACWVATQRQKFKANKLSSYRIDKLQRIGFAWSLYSSWDIRFKELQAYQQEHGDCYVNQCANSTLYGWSRHQRKQYKKGTLSNDRKMKLDSIGFDFEAASILVVQLFLLIMLVLSNRLQIDYYLL